MYSVVLMAALTAGTNSPARCFGCHGCWGCFGCHGCYSSCHGCWGCHGCSGGYGCSCHGCYGCYTSYAGCWGYNCGGYGCGGYYTCGCYGCHGGYGAPMAPPAPAPLPPPKPAPEQKKTAMARLVIELPEDARLFVDDQLMKSTSARREFSTPALQEGATYFYDVRAELTLNGNKHTETKRVILHAGDIVRTSFPELQRLTSARTEGTTTASR